MLQIQGHPSLHSKFRAAGLQLSEILFPNKNKNTNSNKTAYIHVRSSENSCVVDRYVAYVLCPSRSLKYMYLNL